MRGSATFLAIFLIAASLVGADDGIRRPPMDRDSGRYLYQAVVPVEGVAAAELYSRAKAWVAVTYRSANSVLQLDDASSGRLIAKGNYPVFFMLNNAWINHTLTIEVKEGRYRYTLTDFVFDNGAWSAPLEQDKKFVGGRKGLFARVCEAAEASVVSLAEAMKKPTPAADTKW